MVSLRTLILFYKRHLRVQPLRELMTIMGIAAGVALIFAVQVANKSVTGSFEQLSEGIVGRASLEVAARGPQGFDQKLFRKVDRLPDVETAAPVVERRIAVSGPKGRRALTLVGFDDRLKSSGGKLIRNVARRRDVSNLGFYLTEPTAKAIGVRPGGTLNVEVGEHIKRLPLAGVASSDDFGPLVESPIAIAHLGLVQDIASMPGRVTRILVVPVPGRESQTKSALKRVSGGKLNVRSSNTEAKLLKDAANAERQLTSLFSLISLIVGVLLAYNAMLLALAERRAFISYLRQLGATNMTIIATLLFDALVIGIAGSILGILIGNLLSLYVFHQVPDYLASAFAIGSQRVVTMNTIILSLALGIFAALAAATRPAINLFKASPLGEISMSRRLAHKSENAGTRIKLFWIGTTLIVITLAASMLVPDIIVFGIAALFAGIVLLLPILVTKILRIVQKISRRLSDPAARLSIAELVNNPTRSIALAATGALAVFAIVSINGSTNDLQRGGRELTGDILSNADLWVRTGGDENVYDTEPFNHRETAKRIRRLPIVKSVHVYRQSFLDLPHQRLWVGGVPSNDRILVAPSQIVKGDFTLAQRRLRRGGWAALTSTVADALNLRLGQAFTLPTPSGTSRFRLAATISHYGWFSGTVAINADDYSLHWNTAQASQLAVILAPGVPLSQGKIRVRQALGNDSALSVQAADERRADVDTTVRQGLSRLTQISNIVLFAAIMSVVTVMLAAVWQRRERLDSLVSMGMSFWQLARMLFLETGLILFIGCFIGMAFGLVGQPLVDKWLSETTGAPAPFVPAWWLGIRTIVLAGLLSAMAAIAVVRLTVRFKPRAAFSPE